MNRGLEERPCAAVDAGRAQPLTALALLAALCAVPATSMATTRSRRRSAAIEQTDSDGDTVADSVDNCTTWPTRISATATATASATPATPI